VTVESARDLGAFLRRKRGQTAPSVVGLPADRRRRTSGLRREEVALLSGVGLTWYTWLEQGRANHPSRAVLDAIAQTLQLSPAEHDYVLRLAGHEEATRETDSVFPKHGQRVLDALGSCPAYAMAWDWTVVAWNAAYTALYPTISRTPATERNLLWLVWTDPEVRRLLGDWSEDRRRFVAMYRSDLGPRVGTPQVGALVRRLRETDPEFGEVWDDHDVDGFESRTRVFMHPVVGRLELEHHQMSLRDAPGAQIVVYTPARGSEVALGRMLQRWNPTSPSPEATSEP